MTDQPKPKPRFDSDNIGRCVVTCPRHGHCVGASAILTCGMGICEPWARQAARDHEAMEAVRSRAEGAAGVTGMPILRLTYLLAATPTWRAEMDGLVRDAPDPADAILKAAEAAEKGE